MEGHARATSPSQNRDDDHFHFDHLPLRPKHAHIHVHRNLKRKRESMDKRQVDIVQTALDVIVVSGTSTAGDFLIGSIPSNPTTVTLPGFGPLTLSSLIPAAPTDISTALTTPAATSAAISAARSAMSGSPAPTAPANASSLTPSMTGLNGTTTSSSSSSSIAWNYGVAVSANGTSLTSSFTSSASSQSISSSSSSLSSTTSFFTSTSMTSSSSSSSTNPSSTTGSGFVGGGAGGPAATSATSTPTAAAAASSNTNNNAGPIAGGVVGGVAGAAVLGMLIFLLLRWYRKRQTDGHSLLADPNDEEARNAAQNAGPSPPMTQRSSLAPLAAAVRRFRPDSTQTAATTSTTAPSSERGFQKVGGRKLTSVLMSGGDGYSEPHPGPGSLQPPPAAYGTNRDSNLSGTSFYRDSNSHYGGSQIDSRLFDDIPPEVPAVSAAAIRTRNMQAAPSDSSTAAVDPRSNRGSIIYQSAPTGNPFTTPDPRADRALATFSTSAGSDSSYGLRGPTPDPNETLTWSAGPLRTPVITGGDDPLPSPPARRPGHGQDGLGRSQPSWDGSRHSRFSEAI